MARLITLSGAAESSNRKVFSIPFRYLEMKKAQSQRLTVKDIASLTKIPVLERRNNEKFYVNNLSFFFQTEQVKYLVCLEGSNLPRNRFFVHSVSHLSVFERKEER